MSFKVGVTSDILDAKGEPVFGLTHNLGGFPQRNVCAISIVGKYGA